jgi:hypothetical protein
MRSTMLRFFQELERAIYERWVLYIQYFDGMKNSPP